MYKFLILFIYFIFFNQNARSKGTATKLHGYSLFFKN